MYNKNFLSHALLTSKLANWGIRDYSIHLLDKVDSTNKYALLHAHNFSNKTIITSETQTDGYGRNGKNWLSRPGIDLSISFLYRFKLTDEYSLLPLVIAVGVNRLFHELDIATQIKWPNDILLKDRTKVSGILIEAKIEGFARVIVIGVGVDNIRPWNRNLLFCNLVKHIDQVVYEYQTKGFSSLRQEWLEHCIHYRKQVTLLKSGLVIASGLHLGITLDGGIEIQDETSTPKIYNGSQFSLTF